MPLEMAAWGVPVKRAAVEPEALLMLALGVAVVAGTASRSSRHTDAA